MGNLGRRGRSFFVLLLGIIIVVNIKKNETTIAIGTPEDLKKADLIPHEKKETPTDAADSAPAPKIETANRESTVTAGVPRSSFNPILKSESSTEATDNGVRRTPDLTNRMNTSWVKLFNGKDLSGWKPHPTQQGQWHVKNGVLIGSGGEISHLYTERDDYRNFHLKAEVRFSEGASGAIIVRSGFGPGLPEGAPQYPRGFHATINSSHPFRRNTGGVYNGLIPEHEWTVHANAQRLPPGEWFTMEILTTGENFEVFVNGRLTAYFKSNTNVNAVGHLAFRY